MNIFKVSKAPWAWYWVTILLAFVLGADIWIYGFAAPYLTSAADWFLVIVGLILAIPVGLGLNVYTGQVISNSIKNIFNKEKQ